MALKLLRKSVCQLKLSNAFSYAYSNLYFIPKEARARFLSRMENIKIGTHDGQFHCDEALACFMLKLLPRYEKAKIIRTRRDEILKECDIVVDVGGVYDPPTHRYDHHMRTFNETVSSVLKSSEYNSTIKLSSAGLIFCHFGHELISHITCHPLTDDDVEVVFKRVYDTIMKEIDAIDNGIEMCDFPHRYDIVTDLNSRIQRLNPVWNSDTPTVDRFEQAMSIAGEEFLYHVRHCIDVWLPAKRIISNALANRFEWDESGEIIVLDQFGPWAQHLFDMEEEQNIKPGIKFVIWRDHDTYRVRAVPIAVNSFTLRNPLCESWRGLRNVELERMSGIEGAIFVHSVGFIGGHKTLNGAIAMAKRSLKEAGNSDVKK